MKPSIDSTAIPTPNDWVFTIPVNCLISPRRNPQHWTAINALAEPTSHFHEPRTQPWHHQFSPVWTPDHTTLNQPHAPLNPIFTQRVTLKPSPKSPWILSPETSWNRSKQPKNPNPKPPKEPWQKLTIDPYRKPLYNRPLEDLPPQPPNPKSEHPLNPTWALNNQPF